ncbi:MAG: hypothetical protein AAF399_24380, partial [Bacteroidota bacterium]
KKKKKVKGIIGPEGTYNKRLKNRNLTEAEETTILKNDYERDIYGRKQTEVFGHFGGKAVKKAPGTTNCSISVSEVLFQWLGGNTGAVNGESIQNNGVNGETDFTSLGKKFQGGGWVKALEETGIGTEVPTNQLFTGLQPGDILSSGKHRFFFVSYQTQPPVPEPWYKEKKRVGEQVPINIMDANLLKDPEKGQRVQLEDAIREDRTASIKIKDGGSTKYEAVRIKDHL